MLDRALPAAWATAVADAATAFGIEFASVQDGIVGPEDRAEVRLPTLSVVNSEERWDGFRDFHDALQGAIPSCEGVRVDVPSHLLQICDAGPVAEAIAGFLPRHPLH